MSDVVQRTRDLVPAYVLGALNPEETRAFEAALARDPELQREVREYREVKALLAEGQSLSSRSEFKARLLERIRDEKHVVFPTRPAGRRRILPMLLGFGLAASVLFAIGLGFRNQELIRELRIRDSVLQVRESRLAERERTLNSILEPGVELTLLTATGPDQPGVQLFRDKERNTAIIHAFRLRPAPAGRAYQLWIIPTGGGNPIPSRVFNSDSDGHALVENVEVPADIVIEMYTVTEEPVGGSPQPTSAPFLVGRAGS